MLGDLDTLLLNHLQGVQHTPQAIAEALADIDPSLAIPGLSREALTDLLA